jgi:hypothetical protein
MMWQLQHNQKASRGQKKQKHLSPACIPYLDQERVKYVSSTVHVNQRSEDKLHSSRTTDIDTVAAVFISRHAHDMIETRKRRFLDATISEFFLLPYLAITTLTLYDDILRRRVKTVFKNYCSQHRLVERN